jgi:glycogen debranching enzyme
MSHRVELRPRPTERSCYSGRSLLVTNLDGWVAGSGLEGFYVDETRLLSRREVTISGMPLTGVATSPIGGTRLLSYAEAPEQPSVPAHAVYIEDACRVGDGLREELRFHNYSAREATSFELGIHLGADFADLFEAKDGTRQQTGPVETCWDAGRQELVFRYGHPGLDRAVAVRIESAPAPVRCEEATLLIPIDLAPREATEIHLVVEPIFDGVRRSAPDRFAGPSDEPLDRIRRQLGREAPALTTTNPTVARAWRTAVADLASLPLGLEGGPAAPIAGIPFYQQFFGRDMLTISWQALLALPSMMRDSLRLNAAWQGTVIDNWLDEEPGKMIHQARWGPLSILGIDPFIRYYGDYATAPDFLVMLSQYLAWTNDIDTVRELLPAARKAIGWLDDYADLDGDGFIEYVTRSEKGVKNQGWKDSGDAIIDERGEVIENPIATCELQAYWYAGLELGAAAFFIAGDRAYALELMGKARDLKRRFNRAFWMEDTQFYALALGPDKQPIRSIASNAGHLLTTGIVPRERGRRVARRLMEPDMFSGWGIRTLSSEHVAYNPFSYHLGSVWPVENGTIAFGLARYGCWDELYRLTEGLFAATDLFEANQLPEVMGGLARDERHPHPGIYPASCAPQGWSASMIVLLIQAILGLRPVAPLGLLLVDPHLPPWLPDLRLEGIQVGESLLDLEVKRAEDGSTDYRVNRRAGRVRVVRQPVPQGRGATIGGRLRAALGSLPGVVWG